MPIVAGAGPAGCDVALEMSSLSQRRDVLLVDDTRRRPKRLARATRLAIGEGQDVGREPRRAYGLLRARHDEVVRSLTALEGLDLPQERLALLAFSASDGAGGSAAMVLARALREATEDRIRPVAVVGLPAATRDADAPGLRAASDAWLLVERALQLCDGVVLVEERGAFPHAYVARVLDDLLSQEPAESVDETVATLGLAPPGRAPGVTAVGRASQLLHGPVGYALPFLPYATPDLAALVAKARDRLTLKEPAPPAHASAFLVARAPERALAGEKAASALREAQLALAQAGCRKVASGTATTERHLASVTVGLTYEPGAHPRVVELREAARRHERSEGIAA